MFIQKAVENLLADRDIKRAAHAELRATCEQVLEEIRYMSKDRTRCLPPRSTRFYSVTQVVWHKVLLT